MGREVKVGIMGNDCLITIQGNDQLITIKATLGAKYLEFLVKNSNRAFSPIRLRNIVLNGMDLGLESHDSIDIGHKDISYNYRCYDFISSSDFKTIKQVRAQIKKINLEIFEATCNNDLTRVEELYDEEEKLEKYLSETISINGVMKNFDKSNRKDYYSIHRALEKSLQDVEAVSAYVAKLLRGSLSLKMNEIVYRK